MSCEDELVRLGGELGRVIEQRDALADALERMLLANRWASEMHMSFEYAREALRKAGR
jgi:hypothetical protein